MPCFISDFSKWRQLFPCVTLAYLAKCTPTPGDRPYGKMLRKTNVFPSLKKWKELFTQPKVTWTPPPKKTFYFFIFYTLYSVQTCFGLNLTSYFHSVCLFYRCVCQRSNSRARAALEGCSWSSTGRQERTAGYESALSRRGAARRGSHTRTTWSSTPTSGARYGTAGWETKPPQSRSTVSSNRLSGGADRSRASRSSSWSCRGKNLWISVRREECILEGKWEWIKWLPVSKPNKHLSVRL